jgi:hypothetical protein
MEVELRRKRVVVDGCSSASPRRKRSGPQSVLAVLISSGSLDSRASGGGGSRSDRGSLLSFLNKISNKGVWSCKIDIICRRANANMAWLAGRALAHHVRMQEQKCRYASLRDARAELGLIV